jgi:endoglucanase
MKKYNLILIFVIFFAMLSTACKGNDPASPSPSVTDPVFKASSDSLKFTGSGGYDTLTIIMNGSKWAVSSNQSWCSVSEATSSKSSDKLIVTATENTTGSIRTATLTLVMDLKTIVTVQIKQEIKQIYPNYSNPVTVDVTGMSNNAKPLAAKIFLGWNLGNSLECTGSETAWGNPVATQTLINSIKAAGFNAVRIPCAWDSYIEDVSTCKLKASWLARVKEVVDYCYKNDMYVILNIHWDGGWLENNPTYAKQIAVNAKQKALWEQIAVYFRNYDEHLLFAGTNEVHVDYNAPTAENITVQQSYNQTFVNAVRSTGGKNAYRNLIVQSYNTNIGYAISYLKIPTDIATSRLMVEVHYYDPWDFCGDTSGNSISLWGTNYAQYGPISTWGQESYVQSQFQSLKTNFVDKGYPVILGEYGAIRRSSLSGTTLTNHLASRAYYYQYVTEQAKKNGIVPFYWDNGNTGNNGFGLFNRNDGSTFDSQALTSLITGATNGTYPY